MSISKKKILAIKEAGISIFMETLKTHYDDHEIGQNKWFDTPPDMWFPEEIKIFDALTDFQTNYEKRIFEILNNEKIPKETPTSSTTT